MKNGSKSVPRREPMDFSLVEERILNHPGVKNALDLYHAVRLMAPTTHLLNIHTITAALMHRVPYSEVTREQRQRAKSLNWFWLYQPDAKYEVPPRDQLFAIYSPSEIKQLQIDLKWDGSEDLYEPIKRYFQPVK